MRSPASNIIGNLMWTRNGSVWAIWRLTALPYGFRRKKDKRDVRTLHRALIRALPGESLLLSLCAELDPVGVVERMIEGVDMSTHPDWAAECEATLDTLEDIGIGQRVFFLAVPLGESTLKDQALSVVTSAWADVQDTLGVPRSQVSSEELTRRQAQAHRVAQGIPRHFHAKPATPAQLVWTYLHSQQRGLFADMALPEPGGLAEEMLIPHTGAMFPEPLVDEGGKSDLSTRALKQVNPMDRRYVKVTQSDAPGSPPASYQALLALANVPADGMIFPGSEFLGRIDEAGLEVDWAMRLTVKSSAQIAKANRRALINLNDQYDQQSGDISRGMNELDRAAADLHEYLAIFDSDKNEVEAQATVVFAVGSPDGQGAMDQARLLAEYFADSGYKLSQPVGDQTELWWSMMIGHHTTRVVREYVGITTAKSLAAAVPLASTDLGDNKGPLSGINISSGRRGVVLHDIAGSSTVRNKSGSVAMAGELGVGKSVLQKSLCGQVIDRGGQVIAVDRTPLGEWAKWANAVTDSVVVDVADPEVSLDPLRMYGAEVGGQITQSFLTTLLNVAPMEPMGAILSEVLDPDYLREHQLTGLGDLLAHLQGDLSHLPDPAHARELARKMNVIARKKLGRVVFDNTLPPLKITTPATVIRTHTLQLPDEKELYTPHLFKQMSVEKVFGRAIYTLIAGLAREICFSNPNRLCVFELDECNHVTSNPEGLRLIIEMVRDGRKHLAAVILGMHDALADLPDETLRGLIPTKFQFRHSDKKLARNGLEFLGMDADDEELVEMLISDTSPVGPNGVEPGREGEAFMRDSLGRIGRIKTLAPSLPDRREATLTTPSEEEAA